MIPWKLKTVPWKKSYMGGSQKILITGGFGNLGSWLCEYYNQQGYEVVVLSKSLPHLKDIHYRVIQADISNLQELTEKLSESFDFCIHTASYNEYFHEDYAKKALMINAFGTRNLLEVLKKSYLKKFLYFSTYHVYGNDYTCIKETCELSPVNDYASTHLFAEYYIKQFYNTYKIPYIICRLTNSYGAPKYRNSTKWYLVLNDLVKSAYEKQTIFVSSNGTASRDFIWMGDVCKVSEELLSSKMEKEIYNLSSGHNYQVIDLASKVKDVYQKRYQQNINISVNVNDKNIYQKVIIENKKLLRAIDFNFSSQLEREIEKIFTLLENSDA